MSSINLDKLTELCAFVREARQRWDFDEADLTSSWETLSDPLWETLSTVERPTHRKPGQERPAHGNRPSNSPPGDSVDVGLRRLRQLASTAILWRDANGRATLEETGLALSRLAEHCLERALTEAERRVAERFGELLDEDGTPIRLAVLGMGKLGAGELNFNSDIDLIFVFSGESRPRDPRHPAAREYLTRVAQALVAIIDQVTEHGRVWAVDTRLRPFGAAGALVWPAAAMEQYYMTEGRTWERYALIKARPVAGDIAAGEQLLSNLRPFVYRRYLDYGIFDQLRDIQREIRRDAGGQSDNIKRGQGGIRELEFIVQSLQLLRGGHHAALRAPGFLPALTACRELSLLPPEQAGRLAADYRFLRTLENRLQATTGRQTHDLPAGDENRAALARLMGTRDWPALSRDIEACRERVRDAFVERFRESPPEAEVAGESFWPPGDADLEARLAAVGFMDPKPAAGRLRETADRLAEKPLSAEGRRRLDALMPRLMTEIAALDSPDVALTDLLRLIETVARRSAYLSLLREQPDVLRRLVRVFAESRRVAEWIIAGPHLLDDLIDPVHGYALADPPAVARDDPESTLAALARYRQTGFLRTALGELDGKVGVGETREQLSRLAERIVQLALELATGEEDSELSVIAYGNLGAGGMHYESDLDLVFLHENGRAPPLRTAQRLVNLLQMPGPGGRLYEIDTRLRPNGRAGLLVSTVGSFREYQTDKAWTWEHQALVRARWIAGDARMKTEFEAIRRQVLSQPRDAARTARELSGMRRRQRAERRENALQRLRIDIQFIAELGLLINAGREPEITRFTATGALLEALGRIGWLEHDESRALADAWTVIGRQQHMTYLRRESPPAIDEGMVRRCGKIWRGRFEVDA